MKAIATAITIPLVREYSIEKRTRLILLIMLTDAVVGYIYFVASSTLNIIARKDAHTQMSQVESAIAQLESEYFSLSKSITSENAETLGFVSIKSKNFVTRTTLHASAQNSSNVGI